MEIRLDDGVFTIGEYSIAGNYDDGYTVEESNGVPTYIEASSWCPMASIGDVFESAKFSITITD